LNKKGLYDTLVGRNICTAENFEDFFYGFSQSSPRFSIVDIGQGLQGPEVKIKGESCSIEVRMAAECRQNGL
jgi:hypothetical protein